MAKSSQKRKSDHPVYWGSPDDNLFVHVAGSVVGAIYYVIMTGVVMVERLGRFLGLRKR
jgi:hypothetical protein